MQINVVHIAPNIHENTASKKTKKYIYGIEEVKENLGQVEKQILMKIERMISLSRSNQS